MSNLEISRAQRLDRRVVELIPELSRAFATKLIEDGKVTVSGKAVLKPGYKLRAGEAEQVRIDYDRREIEAIPSIKLPILYEDDDCVVINKPAGVLTHSKGLFNPEATVETWLRNHVVAIKGKEQPDKKSRLFAGATGKTIGLSRVPRAGIVHRLDRATSGVMICAKTPEAHKWLQRQFSNRKVSKTYYAVVDGTMPHSHAVIDMPLARNPKRPQTFKAMSNGKIAVTEYVVSNTNSTYTMLELHPQTGRTHQLRVHLREIGHPIVGDTLYGGSTADRLYLHATELTITLPNRTKKTFSSKLPPEFKSKIKL